MGRPTRYTPELAEAVCKKITEGMSLPRIGRLPGYPHSATICRWLAREGEQFDVFREQYARAREARADARFEKLRELGDKAAAGKIDSRAARVAADIEKWCLSREAPKKYGDALTLKGDKDNPLHLRTSIDLSDAELLAVAAGEDAALG